jgi:integral membrane protein (TIGR01906 family)
MKINFNQPSRTFKVVNLLVIVLVPMCVYLSSLKVFLTHTWVGIEYSRPDYYRDYYGWGSNERLKYSFDTLDFLIDNKPVEYLSGLKNLNQKALFLPEEVNHMEDVKQLMNKANWVLSLLAFFVSGAVVLLLHDKYSRHRLAYTLMMAGLVTMTITTMMVMLISVLWDFFFKLFHEIFFQAGTWTFATSDSLIRLYPEKFWVDTAAGIIIYSTLVSVLLTLAPRYKKIWNG